MRRLLITGFITMAACGGNGSSAVDARVAACAVTPGTDLALEEIASGLERPVFVTSAPSDDRIFIVEQPGRIRIFQNGALLPAPFLDITGRVHDSGNEQGLLGLTFHPQFPTNGRFYVNYTASDPQGDTVVAELRVSMEAMSDPNVADPDSETRLLTVAQPYSNHNGGMVAFGSDDLLYIGLGDGGNGGDPEGHGQDTSTMLGSILRIDVDGAAPYAIPASNPFASSANGPTDPRPEIWAFGLRNPWRFSFDRQTGELYIGDVGQGVIEEIDVAGAAAAGINFGWNTMEGTRCFGGAGCDMTGLALPIAEYDHSGDRCSVTGGYVYRGACLPDIQGWYFYADYCTNQVWKLEYPGDLTPVELSDDLGTGVLAGVSSFGEDIDGELYITSLGNGRVFRIVAAPQ